MSFYTTKRFTVTQERLGWKILPNLEGNKYAPSKRIHSDYIQLMTPIIAYIMEEMAEEKYWKPLDEEADKKLQEQKAIIGQKLRERKYGDDSQ